MILKTEGKNGSWLNVSDLVCHNDGQVQRHLWLGGSWTDGDKQTHSITLPPPYFTLDTLQSETHSGWRWDHEDTWTFLWERFPALERQELQIYMPLMFGFMFRFMDLSPWITPPPPQIIYFESFCYNLFIKTLLPQKCVKNAALMRMCRKSWIFYHLNEVLMRWKTKQKESG